MGYSGGLDAFKTNRQNREMAKHASKRNFRRRGGKITSTAGEREIPKEKQFGSNHIYKRKDQRRIERIIVGLILVGALLSAVLLSI